MRNTEIMEKAIHLKTRLEVMEKICDEPARAFINRLAKFLVQGDGKYFSVDNRAFLREDFDKGWTPRIYRHTLVEIGEVLIVDLEDWEEEIEENGPGSAYFIVESTKRKYRAPSGTRLVPFRVIARICKTDEIKNWKAGYWLVPNL